MTARLAGSYFALLLLMDLGGCKKGEGSGLSFQTVGRQPDVPPVMLNKELPFRYPPALYAQKVQGNVTLRIFIDREGAIVPDSTRIAETSGFSSGIPMHHRSLAIPSLCAIPPPRAPPPSRPMPPKQIQANLPQPTRR